MGNKKGRDIPLRANTAMQAVISLCTFIGTSSTSCLMDCTAPAFTIAVLFFSELAARFRSVEIAWHCTSSLSLKDKRLMRGCRNPDSMMGDSFRGCIETFRTHAADERIKGR
jgi:hypothetical protein